MTAQEWALWKQYYAVAPWDDLREYLHAAMVCSTVANFAGKTLKKGVPPTTTEDFVPAQYKVVEEADPMQFFGTI